MNVQNALLPWTAFLHSIRKERCCAETAILTELYTAIINWINGDTDAPNGADPKQLAELGISLIKKFIDGHNEGVDSSFRPGIQELQGFRVSVEIMQ